MILEIRQISKKAFQVHLENLDVSILILQPYLIKLKFKIKFYLLMKKLRKMNK